MIVMQVGRKRLILLLGIVSAASICGTNLSAFAATGDIGSSTPTATDEATTTMSEVTIDDVPEGAATSSDAEIVSSDINANVGSTIKNDARAEAREKEGPPIQCASAYIGNLYNTRSGHALTGAKVIGTQAWMECTAEDGTAYEFKITPEEYQKLGEHDAEMPYKWPFAASKVGSVRDAVVDENGSVLEVASSSEAVSSTASQTSEMEIQASDSEGDNSIASTTSSDESSGSSTETEVAETADN